MALQFARARLLSGPPTPPLGEFQPETVCLQGIVRTMYHESLGDVPSMLTEICGQAEMSSVACLLLLLAAAKIFSRP